MLAFELSHARSRESQFGESKIIVETSQWARANGARSELLVMVTSCSTESVSLSKKYELRQTGAFKVLERYDANSGLALYKKPLINQLRNSLG